MNDVVQEEKYKHVPGYSFFLKRHVLHVGGSSLLCDRLANQDALVGIENCFAVGDGVGGVWDGELASIFGMQTVEEDGPCNINGIFTFPLEGIFQAANRKVYRHQEEQLKTKPGYRIASTMVMVRMYEAEERGFAEYGDVGDSSILYGNWRTKQELEELAEEHTAWQRMVQEEGELPTTDREIRIAKNTLSRYLGRDLNTNIHYGSRELKAGDIYLLCSDGLTKALSRETIREIIYEGIQNKEGEETIAMSLIDTANEDCGRDNATALLIRVEERSNP